MSGRRLIIGDLHGSFKALRECLDKTSFNPEEDALYSVGDIADGYPDVYECLSFLRAIPSFHPVIGNHDVWLQNWLSSNIAAEIWRRQGGEKSMISFERNNVSAEEKKDLVKWMSTWPYVIMLRDAAIMHGGPGFNLSDEDVERLSRKKRKPTESAPDGLRVPRRKADTVLWDREYFRASEYDEKTKERKPIGHWTEGKWLFTGHTEFGKTKPFISHLHRFVNLDTMAGSYGCLTLMDMDTFEYWQSEYSSKLYPGYGPGYW